MKRKFQFTKVMAVGSVIAGGILSLGSPVEVKAERWVNIDHGGSPTGCSSTGSGCLDTVVIDAPHCPPPERCDYY